MSWNENAVVNNQPINFIFQVTKTDKVVRRSINCLINYSAANLGSLGLPAVFRIPYGIWSVSDTDFGNLWSPERDLCDSKWEQLRTARIIHYRKRRRQKNFAISSGASLSLRGRHSLEQNPKWERGVEKLSGTSKHGKVQEPHFCGKVRVTSTWPLGQAWEQSYLSRILKEKGLSLGVSLF